MSSPGVVCMTMTPDCPLCQTYSTEFVKLANEWSRKGLKFYAILPGEIYSDEEIRHFQDSFQFDLPVIVDKEYELVKQLGATVTPEFFLLDSTMAIKYQGKYDDWATGLARKKPKPTKFYLAQALEQFYNGQTVTTAKTEPLGCLIEMD